MTTVLVVDDDDVFRRTTIRNLELHDYTAVEAADSVQAHVVLDTDPSIEAVLCDIRLPGRSGIELLREITNDHPDVAVVMTTAIDNPRMAELAFEIGAFGYLVKPFDTNALLINLASALRRRELEIARRAHVRALEQTVVRTAKLNGVLDSIDAGQSGWLGDPEDTIERLSRALSLRDEETGRHIERMSRYAAVLAAAVGFDGLTEDDVRLATALHDVGKIGIPDSVLLKPGPLSRDEYATMQRHAQIGYQLLVGSISDLLHSAAGIALAHHEWWDGGGYPRGLRGTEIPEEARIAAVTDVFDALTNNRVYRPAMGVDEAIAIMVEGRGRQFEPRLLDAFLDSLDDVSAIRDAYPDRGDDEGRIRVLIVDDQEIFSHSLARLLNAESTIKVIGTAATVADARAAALAHDPDVVLMDFELPDGDGADATAQIKALVPRCNVVMLTARTDEAALVRGIAAGCSGFVTKHEATESLVQAIQAAHEGEAVTPLRDVSPLLRQLRPTHRGLGSGLRPREIEVLELIASGLSNKQIAEQLTLSLNTVRNHVQNVLYKLQAHSKLEAVATAVREGIIAYPRQVSGQ